MFATDGKLFVGVDAQRGFLLEEVVDEMADAVFVYHVV